MNQLPLRLSDRLRKTEVSYWCLLVIVVLNSLVVAFAEPMQFYLKEYSVIPCVIFLYIAFTRKKTTDAKLLLGMGLVMTAWFLFIQAVHHHTEMATRPMGMFFSIYLLALPFAACAREGERCTGLKTHALGYLGGTMILLIISVLLLSNRVPQSLVSTVYYDFGRLNVLTHPNIFGGTLLVGVGFGLMLLSMVKKAWIKVLLTLLVVLEFLILVLTNCRSAVIMGCLLMAGFVFFVINKGGFLRFTAGAVAALLVAAGCFFGSQELFARHQKRIMEILPIAQVLQIRDGIEDSSPAIASAVQTSYRFSKADVSINAGRYIATATPNSMGNSWQRPLLETFPSFGGRTPIWQEEIKAIRQFPRVKWLGIDYVKEFLERTGNRPYAHSHNSWMEVLMILGIPGLVMACAFTLLAVWMILTTLLSKKTKLWMKTVAMMVICILGIAVTEPYLFLSGWVSSQGHVFYPIDFTFFLCLGYLVYWRAERKKDQKCNADTTALPE